MQSGSKVAVDASGARLRRSDCGCSQIRLSTRDQNSRSRQRDEAGIAIGNARPQRLPPGVALVASASQPPRDHGEKAGTPIRADQRNTSIPPVCSISPVVHFKQVSIQVRKQKYPSEVAAELHRRTEPQTAIRRAAGTRSGRGALVTAVAEDIAAAEVVTAVDNEADGISWAAIRARSAALTAGLQFGDDRDATIRRRRPVQIPIVPHTRNTGRQLATVGNSVADMAIMTTVSFGVTNPPSRPPSETNPLAVPRSSRPGSSGGSCRHMPDTLPTRTARTRAGTDRRACPRSRGRDR